MLVVVVAVLIHQLLEIMDQGEPAAVAMVV
jgi:hypothetical protein